MIITDEMFEEQGRAVTFLHCGWYPRTPKKLLTPEYHRLCIEIEDNRFLKYNKKTNKIEFTDKPQKKKKKKLNKH